MSFIWLVLALLYFSFADYDKTHWGMSQLQVQKLYSHGVEEEKSHGGREYAIVQQAAGYQYVYTVFSFSKEDKLERVVLMFPNQNFPIDIKKKQFTEYDLKECKKHFEALKSKLEIKYKTGIVLKPGKVFWELESKDRMVLTRLGKTEDVCVPVLSYTSAKESINKKFKGI